MRVEWKASKTEIYSVVEKVVRMENMSVAYWAVLLAVSKVSQ